MRGSTFVVPVAFVIAMSGSAIGVAGQQDDAQTNAARTVAHADFMHMLDFSMTGITHDLAQGQVDSARKHYQEFKNRFAALADICEDCHGVEERFYFTDAVAVARFEAIGAPLDAALPDPAAVPGPSWRSASTPANAAISCTCRRPSANCPLSTDPNRRRGNSHRVGRGRKGRGPLGTSC